ncbi:phage portal protein, partial [Brevibacterium linens]
MNTTLQKLTQLIDEKVAAYDELNRYYYGKQPLAFLAPEAKTALGNRFGRMSSNIPRLAITAISERLRVTAFRTNHDDAQVWADWKLNDLDQMAGLAHREALTLGKSFAIVWVDTQGRPQVSIESARHVAVLRDPGTREVVAAVKRWETATTTEAVLYLADSITRFSSNTIGASSGFKTVEVIENPLGVVPVVPFVNGDRLLDDGVSEINDLIPLVDGLNKTLSDLMISSEFAGRPRRWATGIEVVKDDDGKPINPIPEGPRAMISEKENSKFGQLPGADLSSYEASVNVFLGQIMAVSALPAHYIGITTSNPASADALRASEASLTARAEARQAQFGRSWEWVARLMIAVRTGLPVETITADVRWADAATRSVAQEADAVVKLTQAGILPASIALERLGYDSDEIERIEAAKDREAARASIADVQARADLAR